MEWLRSVGSIKLQVSFAEYLEGFFASLQRHVYKYASQQSLANIHTYVSPQCRPHVYNTQIAVIHLMYTIYIWYNIYLKWGGYGQ